MSLFMRLMKEDDKEHALSAVCSNLRSAGRAPHLFEVAPESFDAVPGKPFAYWVSEAVRGVFESMPAAGENNLVASGTGTLDDFRFLRCWWELYKGRNWFPFAKGGAYSPIYYDQHLAVWWARDGAEMKEWIIYRYGGGHWARNIRSTEHYFRPGLTWPRRTQGGLSLRAMPAGCIFADKGPAVFATNDALEDLLALLAIVNSRAFVLLVSLQMAFGSYEVGVIQKTPIPELTTEQSENLSQLAHRAWSLKRTLDTTMETSHAFHLPHALRSRLNDFDPTVIEAELTCIQAGIDEKAFDLYGFSEEDKQAAIGDTDTTDASEAEQDDDEATESEATAEDALLSWAVGVAFGRFDWRLATGERQAPPEPEPFDPLPAKSPGMLPDDAQPFHEHTGILVDDEGHPHDLPRLIENVLETADASVTKDVRRWLQKDLFSFHLQRYSKSRRKAPIYWPLSTASGSYTLWLYYPKLNDQTLFTAVNDFVDPKLVEVRCELDVLRSKGANRTKLDEKKLEAVASLEQELVDLLDALLEIAPNYRPNHDDGVQITAAPLWPLFRLKPWQKVLKDTCSKLEKGDYDWAHLALNYCPERVLRKCHLVRHMAIAHDVEADFWEQVEVPVLNRGKEASEAKLEWLPRNLSEHELALLIQAKKEVLK